jgi:hypothetical protein
MVRRMAYGGLARVHFAAHDSHTLTQDVYPAAFEGRVGKCWQMLAGVVDTQRSTTFKCVFLGRKPSGKWI